MKSYDLPTRYSPMNSIVDIPNNFNIIREAIRPEVRIESILNKAQIAIGAGLNDACVNYFWCLTIHDLYLKIIAYGIQYFSDAINWDGAPLNGENSLREVKDYLILQGCYTLGIISNKAYYFLNQCRKLRNNFSTAHLPIADIDMMETCNFIKNCIKYSLTFDLPNQGVSIKEIIELMNVGISDVESTRNLITSQAPNILQAIIYSIFSNYCKSDCTSVFKVSANQIIKPIWDCATEETKTNLGTKFHKAKGLGHTEEANEMLSFLKLVGGVSYIPEDEKIIIFNKAAQKLVDAHQDFGNFYSEPTYSSELLSLGYDVPNASISLYTKALLLSYLGNCYGVSTAAQSDNIKMISHLNGAGITALLYNLNNSIDVVFELNYSKPCERLLSLFELIKDKTMLPKDKEFYDTMKAFSSSKLQNIYKNRYNTLIESK